MHLEISAIYIYIYIYIGRPPKARTGHSSIVVGKNLIIYGGYHIHKSGNEIKTEILCSIGILDTNTVTWSKPSVGGLQIYPRYGHTMTYLEGQGILLGGYIDRHEYNE